MNTTVGGLLFQLPVPHICYLYLTSVAFFSDKNTSQCCSLGGTHAHRLLCSLSMLWVCHHALCLSSSCFDVFIIMLWVCHQSALGLSPCSCVHCLCFGTWASHPKAADLQRFPELPNRFPTAPQPLHNCFPAASQPLPNRFPTASRVITASLPELP